jgi:diguanylate cyclase (GGDEF)-like protein/PAS domain S-box-containing protein
MDNPASDKRPLAGRSLRAQATRRLLWVGLIAMLLLFTVGTFSYQVLIKRDLQQMRDLTLAYYAKALPRQESAQQMAALQLASRIEFSRMLEKLDDSRWPMLTAFLNAQWTFSEFSNMVVLDAERKVIFRYGSEAESLQVMASGNDDWLYAPQYHQFYQLFRAPLWLGLQGQGELVLFRTMSNSSMRELAIPQTRLHLSYQDEVVAVSEDIGKTPLEDSDKFLRLELVWPSNERLRAGKQPHLVIYRDLKDMLPFVQFVARPIILSMMIIGILWYGLGRWLKRTTWRIESLGEGARSYAEGAPRAGLDKALAPALTQNDEVMETARAFVYLVSVIEERDQEQRSYLETLALLEEAVIEFDEAGCILRASPGWAKLTRQEDSLGTNVADFIHDDDISMLKSQSLQLFAGEKHVVTLRMRMQPRGLSKKNLEFWVESRLLAFVDVNGKVVSVRGVLRDITQNYMHEKQITHMALHDALTELPNRVLLEDRFKIALRLAARNDEMAAVCFIDLDHFKMFNDTLGHKAGDRLLVAFARRLHEHLREGDTLARWGGDEFVLLLPEMKDESGIHRVASKVVEAMQQALILDGNEVRITFSMGTAIFPIDGADMETLFSQADRAMFYAKAQGRNQICYFQDMTSKGLGKKELYIQNRLANAIAQHQIQAWFQPIVDARTGRCASLEVLARWHDEEHGWISPATFIPMAETLGLISALGSQVMLNSLDALKHFNQQGFTILMAVNISKRQLFVPAFVEWLRSEVVSRGLEPWQLVLEVTESVALNDVEKGADIVQELREAGFHIAIDDFGTGYSSLSQLHEINAVELKIDISFVRRIDQADGRSMVQAIVNMADALGMKTVAEGVETEEGAKQLSQMGVTCLQGYLFAKPMPLDEFEAWLEENFRTRGLGSVSPLVFKQSVSVAGLSR